MRVTTFPVFESLDAEKIQTLVKAASHSENLFRIDVFDLINSTNTYLLECARKKSVSGWFCFAEQQSKGRGRLGRNWFSPRGASIYCSVLWHFSDALKDLPALSLAVAVMVVKALERNGVRHGLGLKWPNDIFFGSRKLGGILLERLPPQNGVIPIVIGIGINLQLPPGSDAGFIDIAEITGQRVLRNKIAADLVCELLAGLPVYQTKSLKPFLADWQARDMLLNKSVTVQLNEDFFAGAVSGINSQGELMVTAETGETRHFRCGEVSVRPSLTG